MLYLYVLINNDLRFIYKKNSIDLAHSIETMLTSSIRDYTLRNAIELAILMKSYLSSFRHSLSNIQ